MIDLPRPHGPVTSGQSDPLPDIWRERERHDPDACDIDPDDPDGVLAAGRMSEDKR